MIQTKILDTTISTADTIFTPFNLILFVIIMFAIAFLIAGMHPRHEKTFKISPDLADRIKLYEPPEMPADRYLKAMIGPEMSRAIGIDILPRRLYRHQLHGQS